MATKSKGKILENQVVFDFFGEIEEVKPIRTKKQKPNKTEVKPNKKVKPIKFNHIKKNRKNNLIKFKEIYENSINLQ